MTAPSPASGINGQPSGNWIVGTNGGITRDIVITPSDGENGGTFTPSTVTLSRGDSPSATFVYTPASTGNKSITITNTSTRLSNPSAISYDSQSASTDTKAWVKISGVWKESIVWVKISGVWKQSIPKIKISGNWK